MSRRFTSAIALALPLIAGLVLAGCQGEEASSTDRRPLGELRAAAGGNGDGADRETRDRPPAVTSQLDSGNVAYRQGDYRRARTHYRRAVEQDSASNAAWFGVYMAENALGNEAAADSALRHAGGLAGSEAMHPAPGDTASPGSGADHPGMGSSGEQEPEG